MLDFIKSFQISRKMSLTSNLSFKDWYISWVIDNNQFIQESPNHLVINQISLKTLCHSWWNIHTCYFILTFSCIMLKNSQTLCMKGSKAQDLSTNSEWKHSLVTFDTLHLSFFYAQVLLLEEALPRLETDLPKFQNANAFHIMTISFVRVNFFNWQYFRYWPLGFCTDQ